MSEQIGQASAAIPLRTKPLWRDSADPLIRRTEKWVRTGQVSVGTTGQGCPIECIYCNQQSQDVDPVEGRQAGYLFPMDAGVAINSRIMIGSKIDRTIPLDQLMAELQEYPHYSPNSPVLLENNNDPGTDWLQTLELMDRLLDIDHTGPMVFITKMGISLRTAEKLQKLQEERSAKIIGIVSFSNMPRVIEPINLQTRIKAMRQLKNHGIPVVLSIRPLVDGVNASEEQIRETLNMTRGVPDIITVGGLFVFPENIQRFAEAGYPLSEKYTVAAYPLAKNLPEELRERVKKVAREEGILTPISDHTSCTISRIMKTRYGVETPDRMAHWAGFKTTRFADKCSTYCIEEQMAVCGRTSKSPIEEVVAKAQDKLRQIGYPDLIIVPAINQAGTLLVDGGSLPFEEVITIKQASGWEVINLPPKEAVIFRTRQAFELIGADFDSSFAGAILVGQEWYVFVHGDIDGGKNRLFIKWLRHQNRARMKVIDTKTLLEPKGIEKTIDLLYENCLGLQTREELEEQITAIAGNTRN